MILDLTSALQIRDGRRVAAAAGPELSDPAPAEPVDEPRGKCPEHHVWLARSTVLVVDDEPANVRVLTRMLERAGCPRVLSATDPVEGVRMYREQAPDLLLLDLHMPGMDGVMVLEELRERTSERALHPVLMLTGDARSEARERALLRGANDFVAKPFEFSEVLLRINNLLETRFLYQQLRDQNTRLERAVAARTAALEHDIARREAVQRELRASEARYRHLVENASDMIVDADADGVLRYANPAAAECLGMRPAEMQGLPFILFVRQDGQRAARRFYLRQIRRRQASSYQEVPVVTPDGRELWIGLSVRMLFDRRRVVAIQAVGRDVTERRKLEMLKDDFISVASHELRTPLTSIRAALALLDGGLLETRPERAKHTIALASRNADRLMRLVNDMLDLERLNSGRVEVERRPYQLAEVMAQAAETVGAAAEAADVMVFVGRADAVVSMDPDRILRVMVNLLSNAVKFSPRGGSIWIEAEVGAHDVTVSVRDRGRGIPADKCKAVFERFQQVTASDAREKGGSGLGLAICKSIVEQHGGQIWVESREGEGSTFRFSLPR